MSTWTIIHEGADVTQFVQVASIQPSISGRNWVTGASFTFLTKDTYYGFACEETIELRYGGTVMADGTIVAVERTYVSDVPIEGAQAWKVTIQDVYRTLKERYLSLYDSELLRQKRESPAERISWLIDKIRATDVANGNRHCLTSDKSKLTAGTTVSDDEAFDTPYFDAEFRGQSYYDALNDTAALGEVDWKAIGNPATIRLTNALNPPTLTVELTDADDPSTITPVSESHTVIGGIRSMSVVDDTAQIANVVDVKYGKKVDGKLEGTTGPGTSITGDCYVYRVENADSIAQYGRHQAPAVEAFDIAVWQKARALGVRAIATTAWPQVRGSIRMKYDSRVKAGYYVWLHMVRHQDGSFIAQRRTMVLSLRPVFEKVAGVLRPIWLDVELGSDPFDPPTFTPATPPVKPPKPKPPKPPVQPGPEPKTYPQDGDIYLSSLLVDHLSPIYGNPRHRGKTISLPGGAVVYPESWEFDDLEAQYQIKGSLYCRAFQLDESANLGDWHEIGDTGWNLGPTVYPYAYSSDNGGSGFRMTGLIKPAVSGIYSFIYPHDDTGWIAIDGVKLTGLAVDEHIGTTFYDFNPGWPGYPIYLTAGSTHLLEVNYRNTSYAPTLNVYWKAPGASSWSYLTQTSNGIEPMVFAPSIGVANVPYGRTVRVRYHPRFGGTLLSSRIVDQYSDAVALPFSELGAGPWPTLVVEVLAGAMIERQWPINGVVPGMTFYYTDPPQDFKKWEFRPYTVEDNQNTASGSLLGPVVFSTGIATSASISSAILSLAVQSRWQGGRKVNRIAVRQLPRPTYTATDAAGREAWWRQTTGGNDSPWAGDSGVRYYDLIDGANRIVFELDPSKLWSTEHWVLPSGKWNGAVVVAPISCDGPVDESLLNDGWPAISLGLGSGTTHTVPNVIGPSLLTDANQAGVLDIKLVSPSSLSTTTGHTLDFDPKASLSGKGHSFVMSQVGGKVGWSNNLLGEYRLPGRKGQTVWTLATTGSGYPNFVPKTLRVWLTYPTGRKVEITTKVKEAVSNGVGTGLDISKALPSGLTTKMTITVSYQQAS